MKKAVIAIAIMIPCITTCVAMGAVTVKKAAPVATQAASSTSTTASLVPSVLNLVSNVQQLNAQQKELTTECMPSSTEISFVDNVIKEWAKTGAASAEDVQKQLKRRPCSGGVGYATDVKDAVVIGLDDICYDNYVGSGDKGMVWYGFP